jgi:hypothetical protein
LFNRLLYKVIAVVARRGNQQNQSIFNDNLCSAMEGMAPS